MNEPFDITVVIPTCPDRVTKLRALLSRIARTRSGLDRFEVIVVVDDLDEAPLAELSFLEPRIAARGFTQPASGPAVARNLAIREARGRWLLFFDDDALVDAETIPGHLACIDRVDSGIRVYLGRVDWPERLLDSPWSLLLANTSMLFFWDTMTEEQTYGFRHFWTSNLSVPTELVRQVGGFNESFPYPLHEDIELGWRLAQRYGLEVQPVMSIQSWHDHAITPADYFHREYRCGVTAAMAATINPEFHDAIWGWLEEPDQVADVLGRTFARPAQALRELLERWAIPSPYVPSRDEMDAVYLAHLPLKRMAFAYGYSGRPFEQVWPETASESAVEPVECSA